MVLCQNPSLERKKIDKTGGQGLRYGRWSVNIFVCLVEVEVSKIMKLSLNSMQSCIHEWGHGNDFGKLLMEDSRSYLSSMRR